MQRTTAKAAGLSCAIVCVAFACNLVVSSSAWGAPGPVRLAAVNAASGTSVREAGLLIRPTSGSAPLAIPAGTGATVTSSITLENITADTRFEVRLAVGAVSGTTASPDDAAIGGASSWLTTAATVITLEPGTARDVPVTVVVPRGAAVGPNRAGITVSIQRSTLTASGLVGGGEGATETLPVDIEVTGDSVGDLVILGVAARDDDDGPTLAVRVWNRGSATVAGYGALTYGSRQDAFEIPEVGPRAELEQRVPWSPGDERRRVSVYVTFGEGRVAQWSGTIDPASTDESIAGSPGGTGTVTPGTTGDNDTNGSVSPARRTEGGVPLYLRALVGAAVVIPGWFLAAELMRRRKRRAVLSEEVANAPPEADDADLDTTRRAPRWARSIAPGGDPTMHQQLDRIALALEALATVMVPGETRADRASTPSETTPADEPAMPSRRTRTPGPTSTAISTPTVAPASAPMSAPASAPMLTPAPGPLLTPLPMPAPEIIAMPDSVTTSRWIRSEVDALIARLTVAPVDELSEAGRPRANDTDAAADVAPDVAPADARNASARRRRRPTPDVPVPAAPVQAPPARSADTATRASGPAQAAAAPDATDPGAPDATDAAATPAQLLAAVLEAPVDHEADADFVARVRNEVRSLVDHLHPSSATGAQDTDAQDTDAQDTDGGNTGDGSTDGSTGTDTESSRGAAVAAGTATASAADSEAEMLASIRAQIQAMVNEVEAAVRPGGSGDASTPTDPPVAAEARDN